jgi:hypothetical protein
MNRQSPSPYGTLEIPGPVDVKDMVSLSGIKMINTSTRVSSVATREVKRCRICVDDTGVITFRKCTHVMGCTTCSLMLNSEVEILLFVL